MTLRQLIKRSTQRRNDVNNFRLFGNNIREAKEIILDFIKLIKRRMKKNEQNKG